VPACATETKVRTSLRSKSFMQSHSAACIRWA